MTFEPDTMYRVTLKKPATVRGITYAPRGIIEMQGWLLTELIAESGEAVLDRADPIT